MIGRQIAADLQPLLEVARGFLLGGIEILTPQREIAAMAGRLLDGDLPLRLHRQSEEALRLGEGAFDQIAAHPVIDDVEEADVAAGASDLERHPLARGLVTLEKWIEVDDRNLIERNARAGEAAVELWRKGRFGRGFGHGPSRPGLAQG